MRRWSYFAAVSIAFVLVISLAGASDNVVDLSKKVTALEREIINFKMARADSWMFWMAVFMTIIAIIIAATGVLLPFLTFRSVEGTKREIEAERKRIEDEVMAIEKIRSIAEQRGDEIARMNRAAKENFTGSFNLPRPIDKVKIENITKGSDSLHSNDNREADVLFKDAISLMEEKKYPEAEAIWRKIAENKNFEDKMRSIAWAAIGDIYSPPISEETGIDDRAIDFYTTAVSLDEGNLAALNNRGIHQVRLGNFEKAISDYNKIIELGEEDYGTFANRAHAFFRSLEFDKAIEDLGRAIARLSQDNAEVEEPTLNFQMGTAYLAKGDLARGFTCFETAKKVANDSQRDEIEKQIADFFSLIESKTEIIDRT